MCARVSRVVVVGWVLALGCAGSSKSSGLDGGGGGDATSGFTQLFPFVLPGVDILFMVDNSASMEPISARLATDFPAFTQALSAGTGGLPNVHIAVVSSDLGAGREATIVHCMPGGDGGQFRFGIGAGATAVGGTACTTTGLNPGAHFISNELGVANYDTSMGIDKVFGCIASLGDPGCGFEHQLASVTRALNADGRGLPPGNEGFLRPTAKLAIILLTNEDDCSAPSDSDLFDATSTSVGDPLGPLQSYRCNEFGHLCKGARPPRTMAATFNASECVPAEASGKLLPVATIVDQIKSLKTDPSRIVVSAIAGPPADPNGQYIVTMVDAVALTSDAAAGVKWPNVGHSCTMGPDVFADPAVRITAFVDAFGKNGLFLPLCAPTLVGALQTIGSFLAGDEPACLTSVPPGVDPLAPEEQASCTLIGPGGAIPACSASNQLPCFSLVRDQTCRDAGLRLTLAGMPFDSDLTLHCSATAAGG